MKKKIKKILTELSKKSLILRKIIRKSLYCFRFIQYKVMGIGKKVDDRFCYASDNNLEWLTVEEIREALKNIDIVY